MVAENTYNLSTIEINVILGRQKPYLESAALLLIWTPTNQPYSFKKSRETSAHESIIIRDAVGANYQDCYWSPPDSVLCSSL